jgi:hypothetical protein
MAGSFWSKAMVLRLQPATFTVLVDGMMAVSGGTLLWAAAT